MIKVCIDPMCDEVAHNCEQSEKRCRSCDMKLVTINQATYWKKYSMNFFQYDYQTGNLYRPVINRQLTFNL